MNPCSQICNVYYTQVISWVLILLWEQALGHDWVFSHTHLSSDFLHGTNVTLNQQGRWQMAFSHLTVEFYSNTNPQLGLEYENKLKNVPCPIYSSTDLQESMKSLTSKYFLIFITFSGFLSGMNSDAVQGPEYDWRHYCIQYICDYYSLSHILNEAWPGLNVSPSSLHS